MENAEHNKFEFTRLPEEERSKGRRVLERIARWIKDEIRKQAGPPEGGRTTVLSELAAYLPDLQPDEPFDDSSGDHSEGERERSLGGRVTVRLKPIVRPTPPVLPQEEDRGDEGYGDDVGHSGGGGTRPGGHGENGGNGGGPGEGGGHGGQGGQGGGAVRKPLPISGVRVLPVPGTANHYKVSFLPGRTGTASIQLEEAGDSTTAPLEDVRAADGGSLQGKALVAGERTSIEVVADNPIRERAVRLMAIEQ